MEETRIFAWRGPLSRTAGSQVRLKVREPEHRPIYEPEGARPGSTGRRGRFSSCAGGGRLLYLGCPRQRAMAINAVWNKRSGPGGGTRRLHQLLPSDTVGGCLRGRNRIDARGKGTVFARHGSAVIGPFHKCQRQRCTPRGCLTASRARLGGRRATEVPPLDSFGEATS